MEDLTIRGQKMMSVRIPGIFNLTVCTDAVTAADNIKSHRFWDGAPQTGSTIASAQTADGWTPGTRGVHITHWRSKSQMGRGLKVNDNPLDVMQLSLAIKDSTGKLIGCAPNC